MQIQRKNESISRMHRIVWILIGIFGLCALSFPIALFRVSNTREFGGFHVRSLTIEGRPPSPHPSE